MNCLTISITRAWNHYAVFKIKIAQVSVAEEKCAIQSGTLRDSLSPGCYIGNEVINFYITRWVRFRTVIQQFYCELRMPKDGSSTPTSFGNETVSFALAKSKSILKHFFCHLVYLLHDKQNTCDISYHFGDKCRQSDLEYFICLILELYEDFPKYSIISKNAHFRLKFLTQYFNINA